MIKRLLQNNILLSSSSFLSLIVNILSIPIISRIYTPDDIGIFSSMQIISMIFIPLIGLRMEIIFAQDIKNNTLKSLFTTTILSGLILSIFLFIALLISTFIFEKFLFWDYIIFIFSMTHLIIYFEFGLGLLNRLQMYKFIAYFAFFNILSQRLLQIVLGFFMEEKISAIFISYCLSSFFLVITMYIIMKKNSSFFNISSFDLNVFKNYYGHIFYRTSYTIANLFKDRFLLLIIITLFSSTQAGLYGQAFTILSIPVIIFSYPLKTIITREFVENKSEVIKIIMIIYDILILTILPLYIFLYFHSSFIFPKLLGSEWSQISDIINIMLIPMFILIFSSSLDRLYDVLNVQKWALIFEIFFGILTFTTFLILSVNDFDFLYTMKVNSALLSFFFITFLIFILKKAMLIRHFLRTIVNACAQLIICFIIFYILKNQFYISLVILLSIISIGLILIYNKTYKMLNQTFLNSQKL